MQLNSVDDDEGVFSYISDNDHDDYFQEVDRMLLFYENTAALERRLLYETTYPTVIFEVRCGISPSRSLAPAVTLQHVNKNQKISFDYSDEWMELIDVFKSKINNFFYAEDDAFTQVPQNVKCGSYCFITQLIYDNIKFLSLKKFNVEYLVDVNDVIQFLDINSKFIVSRVNYLENIAFNSFYYNLVGIINENCISKNVNDKLEILSVICDLSNTELCVGLRELLYYYRDIVISDMSVVNSLSN